MIVRTICCTQLVHIDPGMIGTKQKSRSHTAAGTCIGQCQCQQRTLGTDSTARLCRMHIVYCLLQRLLLTHCAEHSWSSGDNRSHAATRKRSSCEVIGGVVAASSRDRSQTPKKQLAAVRSAIHAQRCPLRLGRQGCSAVGSWR